MYGYTSVPKKLTKTQRKAYNRKLKEILGDKWLPAAEFRKAKEEKLKEEKLKEAEEAKKIQAQLPPIEPKDIVPKKSYKVVKGQIHPEVFKSLNLDAKIILFRRSMCKHNNNPKTCLTCKDRSK